MKFFKILLESRESDFRDMFSKKFKPEQIEMIINLSNELPGGSKFLTFLGKSLPDTIGEGLLNGKVKDILKKFVSIGPNLEKKDINQYQTIAELNTAIDAYENRIRRSVQTIEGADLIYEDDRFTVVAPLTTKASCYYGAGTKWCTASSADNSHFGRYMEDGKLFYILDKTKPTSDRFYKVALLQKFDGNETYYDAPDKSFNSGWIFGSKQFKKIKEKIQDYMNQKYGPQIELYKDKEKVRLERERLYRERQQRERNERLELANERRAEGEWNIESVEDNSVGAMAIALFEHLVSSGTIEPLTNEDKVKKVELTRELEMLQQTYDEIENANENTDLVTDIAAVEEELEELNNKKDVYDIIPLNQNGNLYVFTTTDFDGEWLVGNEQMIHDEAYQNVESMIDDIGYEGFNPSFVENQIDYNAWENWLREFFREDVFNNPDVYLSDEDRGLSYSQTDEINRLKNEILGLKEELNNLNDEDEDYDDEVQRIEDEINDLENEIVDIESDPEGDYDDDKLDDALESRVSEYKDSINNFIGDYVGINFNEFVTSNELIDKDGFIQDVIDSDGYGQIINSYDGSVDEERINNIWYYIFYNGDFSGF